MQHKNTLKEHRDNQDSGSFNSFVSALILLFKLKLVRVIVLHCQREKLENQNMLVWLRYEQLTVELHRRCDEFQFFCNDCLLAENTTVSQTRTTLSTTVPGPQIIF